MTEETVERHALDLLYDLDMQEPEDIVLELVALHLGIRVEYRDLAGRSAELVGVGDRASVAISTSMSKGRQRLTLGHEIAHFLFDRGHQLIDCDARCDGNLYGRPRCEQRADFFASRLLMPDSMFSPCLVDMPHTMGSVRELTRRFETSASATALRCMEITREPAVIACYENGRLQWSRRSISFPRCLKLPSELPRRLGPPDGAQVPAAFWFSRSFFRDPLLRQSTLTWPRYKRALVMIHWPDCELVNPLRRALNMWQKPRPRYF